MHAELKREASRSANRRKISDPLRQRIRVGNSVEVGVLVVLLWDRHQNSSRTNDYIGSIGTKILVERVQDSIQPDDLEVLDRRGRGHP